MREIELDRLLDRGGHRGQTQSPVDRFGMIAGELARLLRGLSFCND